MIKKIYITTALTLLILSGCSTNTGPEYDGNSYQQVKTIETGLVMATKKIVISDTGKGQTTGGLIGSVAGSAAGYSSSSFLASVGGAIVGGLAGAAIGSEVGKSDGLELKVRLDTGAQIILVVKQNDIEAGDRIEIIKSGGKVERVNKVNSY